MNRVALVLATMAAFTAVGGLLRRYAGVPSAWAPRLNAIALNVTVPLGVFVALHRFPLHFSLLGAPAIMAVVTLALAALSWFVARAMRLAPGPRALFVNAVTFGNTAFIGFPVVTAALGEAGLAHAVLIDQVGAEPLAYVIGALVASSGRAGQGPSSAWDDLRGLATFPPLWALMLGLAWSALGWPEWPSFVLEPMRVVSMATVPLVMTAMGLVLRGAALRASWRSASVLVLLRAVASPALALGLAWATGLSGLARDVLVLEAAMPAMMFTLVLATRAGLDAELAAAYVAATLVTAPVTLLAWIAWLS